MVQTFHSFTTILIGCKTFSLSNIVFIQFCKYVSLILSLPFEQLPGNILFLLLCIRILYLLVLICFDHCVKQFQIKGSPGLCMKLINT